MLLIITNKFPFIYDYEIESCLDWFLSSSFFFLFFFLNSDNIYCRIQNWMVIEYVQ